MSDLRTTRLQLNYHANLSYKEGAEILCDRHRHQTLQTVQDLKAKYELPLFGSIEPWSLVEMLAQCIDPSDQALLCTSQQVHVLQIVQAMEIDGVASEDMIVAALLHDLGKVLLLTTELPENVIGMNGPIGVNESGIGLDRCVLQWNHDEFAYMRLKEYLPDHLSWLIRYHSIDVDACSAYMNQRDWDYCETYLKVFSYYDHITKSPSNLPKARLEEYRPLLQRFLPGRIVF